MTDPEPPPSPDGHPATGVDGASAAERAASETSRVRSRALRGTFFSLSGHAAAQGLRLVSNLILSRLLFPEAFGVMALVWLVVNALTMLSDVGVRPSVVRDDRGDDPRFLNTAWTVQALRGFLLWAIAAALADPLARFYEEPAIATILPVASLVSVIAGFESTKLLTLSRRVALGRVVGVELAGQAAGLVATVSWALADPSLWALVAGALAAQAVRLVLSHTALPGAPSRFAWDPDAARRIVSFGKWILVSTVITFLATRLDVLLLGKLLPMGELGVYSIGTLIAGVPSTVASRLARAVLLPVLSAAHREGREVLARQFADARRLCLPGGLVAVLGVAATAPAFLVYLYDPRYADAGWIAQLSMLPLWFTFLQYVTRSALEAIGNSRALAMGNSVKLVVTAVGCLVGFRLGGLPGLILGVGLGALAGYGTLAAILTSEGLHSVRLDSAMTGLGLALGLAIGLGPRWLLPAEAVPWATLVVGLPVVAGMALWVLRGLRARAPVA